MTKRSIIRAAAMGLLLAGIRGGAADAAREQAAVAAAGQWLALVDRQDYAASWKEAAAYFRNAVTVEQWTQSARAARMPLGKLVTRTMTSATHITSLPGAPDGNYVVILFATTFENKKAAVETVTPMLEKDGTWRVSGYYIR